VVKPVSCASSEANPTSATGSPARFACRKTFAAATASASGLPVIDLDRSTAMTSALSAPRLFAATSRTRLPFSRSLGAAATGLDVTTVKRSVG
jgi:hypothetical protein